MRIMTWCRRTASTAAAAALALTSAASGGAQELADGRWLPFIGCWEPVAEAQAEEAGLLCVRPEGRGVELFTVADGEVLTSDVLVAGARMERSAEGCEGWETAEFSQDGRRVFTRSEFVCGDAVPRRGSGVMSMVSPAEWVDVRSVGEGEEAVAWVQRYRAAAPDRVSAEGVDDPAQHFGMALRSARIAAAARLQLDDVVEAARAVEDKAVQAWLLARGEGFDLDAEALLAMADEGVSPDVIDVVVAVSYPDRFAVDVEGGAVDARAVEASRDTRRGDAYGYGPRYRGWRPLFWDPFYYGYGYGYGLGYRPYYGPFGYGYGYIPAGPIVIIDRASAAGGGRVVKGRGYTRGRSAPSGGSQPAYRGGGARRAQPAAGSRGSTGSSRPSGSSSTGRKAKPRGGR